MSIRDRAVGERSDAARNRALLLAAAARLVAERGAAHVTMSEVAAAAGVGKGTVFRRFGDRNGLFLALLDDAAGAFEEAYASGPPPLGPGATAEERLAAFGRALIERVAAEAELGPMLGSQLLHHRRHASPVGRAFHRHVSALLREADAPGDHEMLAHALLAFANIETVRYLHREDGVPVARLQATWEDLVRQLLRPAVRP
ncbi:TetR/AcrR family transcriptional regulator [Streptomyces sp. Y7]|uniref:TetR/AcrR family transcriptional regulator n=1 Tax=Streptomyces sp. Y7 TaxID=3342392 RepID=UPI003717EC82